jgi:thiamine biosynthesis lipoprotein
MDRRSLILGTGAVLALTTLPAAASPVQVLSGPAFGTSWRAILPSGVVPDGPRTAIERIIRSVDLAFSPFRTDSELSALNRADTTRWVPVSKMMEHVVQEGLIIASMTKGAFDPTVGPLVNRYGFGPIKGALDGQYQQVELGTGRLRKSDPNLTLDLCGIAKGHALDLVAGALADLGIDNFFVELGGEVFARGTHPSGRSWRSAVEALGIGKTWASRIVALDGMAIATSGSSVNGGIVGGVGFNHIIDPKTRRPVQGTLGSVSVIARTAMQADALATALYVMGPEAGLDMANQQDIAALFQTKTDTGVTERMTDRFRGYVVT